MRVGLVVALGMETVQIEAGLPEPYSARLVGPSRCGPQPNSARFDDGQSSRQVRQNDRLLEEGIDQPGNDRNGRMARQFKNGDPGIILGWVVADVAEIKVAREEGKLLTLGMGGDVFVGSASKADTANVNGVVTACSHNMGGGSRQ
jgi:hypothetical protein